MKHTPEQDSRKSDTNSTAFPLPAKTTPPGVPQPGTAATVPQTNAAQPKGHLPAVPDFLRSPQAVRPVPPPAKQPGTPSIDYRTPKPHPNREAYGAGGSGSDLPKQNSSIALLVIIATMVILSCVFLLIVFNLPALRSLIPGGAPSLPPANTLHEELPSAEDTPPLEYNPCPWPDTSSPETQPPLEEEFEPDIAIEFLFQQVRAFDENGLAPVYDGQGWGLIDKEGTQVLECAFDSISDFSDGYAVVELEGLYGLITLSGEFAIAPEWDDAAYYSEGLLPVARNGKYGFIDLSGNEVIPPEQFDDAFSFEEGVAAVTAGDASFFIDTDGQAVSPRYQAAYSFAEGLAPVRQNGKWGYVDRTFELVIPCMYDKVEFFSQGYAVVQQNGKDYIIDSSGNKLSPPADEVWLQADSFALLRTGEYLGLYDLSEESYLITPQFRDFFLFSEGVMPVTADGHSWFYVDEENRSVFPQEYELALPFREGVASVVMDGLYGLIDRNGTVISDYQWNDAGPCSNGMVAVEKDGLFGFLRVYRR